MTSTYKLVGTHVGAVVHRLQGGYLPSASRATATSEATARLAILRRADPADPASDSRVWDITLEGAPEKLLLDRPEPSAAERAMHAAITLYAVHQQSHPSRPMHVQGTSLGAATQRLASMDGGGELDSAVLRRFHSVATATGWGPRITFLRSLITILRSHDIPLDYQRLAEDLYLLQRPDAAAGVRLRWGRDLHRNPTPPKGQ